MWNELIANMPEERLLPLMQQYGEILQEQREFRELLGVI